MITVIKGCYFFPPSSSIRKAFCRRGSQGSQRWETIWDGGKEPHGIRIRPVCLTLRPELTSSPHCQPWLDSCSYVSTGSICDHWNLLETQNQTHTYCLDCLLTRPPGDHVHSDLWVPSETRIHCSVRQWLPQLLLCSGHGEHQAEQETFVNWPQEEYHTLQLSSSCPPSRRALLCLGPDSWADGDAVPSGGQGSELGQGLGS